MIRARQFIEQNYLEYAEDNSGMSGSMLRYIMEEYSKLVNKQLEVKLRMIESENNSLRLKIEREKKNERFNMEVEEERYSGSSKV